MDLVIVDRQHTVIIFLIIFTCNHLMDNAKVEGTRVSTFDSDYEYEIQECFKMNMIQYTRENLDYSSKFTSHKMGVIQSPNYPSKYQKHIDCVFLIHAPLGHIISIKSYERFDIEPSADCQHDHLEIRDGLFGYSPIIGRYCNGYPLKLPIESSNTEMWIRFKTDDSIEQHGFRIVYEFKEVPLFYKPENGKHYTKSQHEPLNCQIYHKYTNLDRLNSMTISNRELEAYYYEKLNGLIASEKNVSSRYNLDYLKENLDCTIHIEVHRGEQISITFENVTVSMHKNMTKAEHSIIPATPFENMVQDCDTNFLEIYDASTAEFNKKIHYCSTHMNNFFKSKTNRIFIRYSVKKDDLRVMTFFKFTYNPFHKGVCSNDTFRCEDGSCIDPHLVCDGRRNCNSSNDESLCKKFFREQIKVLSDQPIWQDQTKLAYIHKISIMTIGGILVVLIIISLVVSCKRSIKMHLRNVKDYEKNHNRTARQSTSELGEDHSLESREITSGKKWVV